jgi:hypothetical protein
MGNNCSIWSPCGKVPVVEFLQPGPT